MSFLLSNPVSMIVLLLRRGGEGERWTVRMPDDGLSTASPGIKCPHCSWRPRKSSRWTCWNCDHPEYFYNGCGSAWNTFETNGLCPTCGHQWKWTACLRCAGWSRHEDWYER